MASAAVGAIFISGDSQARKVARTQPAKLAAYEGHYRSAPGGTAMTIVGRPDPAARRLDCRVAVPKLLSLMVSGDPDRPVAALDRFAERDRPPVMIPFLAYHAMVYTWGALAGLLGLGLWSWWRGRLFERRRLLWGSVAGVLGPVVANQSGWVSSEVGRQPWVVHGLLRTAEAHSRRLPAGQVGASIAMFAAVYALLFLVWVRLIDRLVRRGPEATPPRGWAGDSLPDAATRRAGAASVGEDVVEGGRGDAP